MLGEADLPARFLGGTYVRSGGTFGRDPARPGAPDNGVRVLLYHRVGGVSTDSSVGLLEIVDSLRQAARDVTTGVVRALDGVPVVALRSEVKRVGPAGSAALHDVIDGTLGRGSAPIAVLDSFVIDALSPTNGRNVVMTSISALGAPLLRSTPARPGGVGSSLLLEVTVGGRRVLLEGSRNLSTGPHVLFVYVNGVEVGRVDTGDLATWAEAPPAERGRHRPRRFATGWMESGGCCWYFRPPPSCLTRRPTCCWRCRSGSTPRRRRPRARADPTGLRYW